MTLTDKQVLNAARRAQRRLHAATGYNPNGPHYAAVDAALDQIEAEMIRRLKPVLEPWEKIGPVQPGFASLLDAVLTHPTSGIPLFPALDTAWGGGGGVVLIAPEDMVVDTKDTSAGPGEAIYCTGVSDIRHWVGHLDRDWPLGHEFEKGDFIGKTLPIPGKSDHAHWGVNVEALIGKGKELYWGGAPFKKPVKYAPGSPSIRTQLNARLKGGDL